MKTVVEIMASDFVAVPNTDKFIFVLFTQSATGLKFNVEDIGNRKNLCLKYGIPYSPIYKNYDHLKGRKCLIWHNLFWRKRPHFIRLLPEEN